MPVPALVENLRALFVSHNAHDERAFRRSADAIIRDFSVENRPSEARTLREALGSPTGGTQTSNSTAELSLIGKTTSGLVSIRQLFSSPFLVFSPETHDALQRVLFEHREASRLAEAGLRPKSRLLFWGPPGCGKTAAAGWLATELAIPLGVVRVGTLITSFVGETGANLQRVLAYAEQTPMVLLIDEADAVAKSREDAQDVGELRRVVNALLQGLDAFNSRHSIIIFASNHSHVFDSAVWRRFDDVISFPLPDKAERLRLLKQLTNGLRLTGSLTTVASKLAKISYADIERAVHEVAKDMVLYRKKSVNVAEIVNAAKTWEEKLGSANKKVLLRSRPS
jgi:SpoVK/Ycf46/Vps4 family AAA+-type ATPase